MNWDEARPHQQQRPFPSGKASSKWTSLNDTFHNSHGPFPEHSISRIWVIVYQEFNCHVILIQLLVTFFTKNRHLDRGLANLSFRAMPNTPSPTSTESGYVASGWPLNLPAADLIGELDIKGNLSIDLILFHLLWPWPSRILWAVTYKTSNKEVLIGSNVK